ncbi:MAG: amino acid adenylation domain-containing protein [Ignavibacteria bacterium]|nr:amino acid adenylation domain-containing protein [Ignavibacteria bacterium]
MLPIQQWYFEETDSDISHFNQSVLLCIEKSVSPEILKKSVEQLTSHHDALRFIYTNKDGEWRQAYGGNEGTLITLDLSSVKEDSFADEVREHAGKFQRSLDIEKGELSKFVLIQTPENQTHNRLLIVIHHLAVDGVSWRILLEDLELLLSEIQKEGKAELGAKSSSYRQWYEALEQYGKSKRLLSQVKYWEEAAVSYEPLRADKKYTGVLRGKDIETQTLRLDPVQTQFLLQQVPRVYHTEINDMLLCALALTLCEWGNTEKVLIGMEGHGRENISDDTDTSRTVGWFTSVYPVLLEIKSGSNLSDKIKSTKEQLRRVPDKGLGYGVLKYINKNEKLKGKDCWDIVFNYLGQLDNVVSSGKWLSAAGESGGPNSGDMRTVSNQLSVNGFVQGGELRLNWSYSSLHYEKETISNLIKKYQSALESLISHCTEQQKTGIVYTPSDYGLGSEINYSELDKFLNEPYRGKARSESVEGIYRLSGIQQGMLFHSLYDGKAGSYINQFQCGLIEPDIEMLKKSWNIGISNHSILRSAFYYDIFRVPVQCVYRNVEIPSEESDYRNYEKDEQEKLLKEYTETDRMKGFDFNSAPLFRMGLLRLSENRYRMLMTYHHILIDGWSIQTLIKEFLNTYELLSSGKEIDAAENDRYEDYIRYIERQDKEKEENFWRNYLNGIENNTLLPFIGTTSDRTKGLGPCKLDILKFETDTAQRINSYAQEHRITLNTLIQGVWFYLLHKYTGSKDIIYGVTVSGRPEDLHGVEKRVGIYINTIPSHATIDESKRVIDWLQEIQYQEASARQYQYTSMMDIQKWTGMQGDLFDSTVTFQNFPMNKFKSADQNLKAENFVINEQNNYPLSLTVISSEKLSVRFSYNSGLLKDEYLKEIQKHFENILLQFIQNEKESLGDVKLLTNEEEHQLLHEFNKITADKAEFRSVVNLFEEQVKKTPNDTAVIFKDRKVTYKELNERSNRLAHYLSSKGVKADSPVFICIEYSVEMINGILGILKAGGAYVPIDPDYPEARIKQMLEDTDTGLIVTNKANRVKFKGNNILVIDEPASQFDDLPAGNLRIDVKENDLAYVIYTSGSTGRPKGVMIEHGNLYNYLVNSVTKYVTDDVNSAGSFLHLSYTFDASVTGIFMPLIHGKSVVISSKQSVNAFEDTNLHKYAPYDFIKITPSHLELLQSKMKTADGKLLTKKLVIGGEALLKSQLSILIEKGIDAEIINEYGPTEATVGCSTYWFNTLRDTEIMNNEIPIGKPIDNVELYILNERDELQPVGIAGELCISGKGLSRGYLNRPELTAEKFSKNPFSEKGERMYRTGDLCRWLPDGTIEYAGRADDQVKIRGYRVELGEIESVLQQCELVNNAVVIAKEDKSGSRRLTAYIVPKNDFEKEAMISYLAQRLPKYMIPSLWSELKSIPLTSNGKIDKKALPDPEITDSVSAGYTEPRNETEAKLAEVWKNVLETDEVGVTDDFFDIGGHSLLAISLISAIRNELGVEIPINDVFDYPTIELLAKRIDNEPETELLPSIEVQQSKPEFIPLSFSQERLWFIDHLGGSTQYHIPAVLRLIGKLNKDALIQSVQTIVNRHEVLRTVFEETDGIVFQKIKEKDEWYLEIQDDFIFEEDNKELNQYIQKLIYTPFDLSKDHMLRAALIRLKEDEHILVVTLHHIASDGWSVSILVKELVELYNSFEESREANLSPLKIQYSDYAIWQRKYLQGVVLENKLSYWKEKLEGVSPLDLPSDFARPAVQSTKGEILNFRLEKELSERIHELSKNSGTTLFMTLLAAFKVLLYRYSSQNDVCVGTPVAGRQLQETEDMIGFFINTIALRSEVKDSIYFDEFLKLLREDTLQAFAHQDVPFEKVVDAVVKDRSLSRSPLFQVMFILQNVPEAEELVLGKLKLSREVTVHSVSKFDLTFSMTETSDGIKGAVEYCSDLFRQDTVERMIIHFKNLLESIVSKPQQRIDSLKMLSESEISKVLAEFNNTKAGYPKIRSFVDLFEESVKINPDVNALIFKDQKMTFKELNKRSNQLAHYLQSKGIGEDSLVPICIERGVEMVIGIIGIMKAGGAYVPVDPDYPEKRIAYILKDTGAAIVLSSKGVREKLSASENTDIDIIEIDGALSDINKQSSKNLKSDIKPGQLAYVIYTSGSTGQPKGVMIEHKNLTSYMLNKKTGYVSNEKSNSGSFLHLSYTFDASLTGMLMPLINGKSIVISSEESLDVFEDKNFMKYAPYDFIKITPAHFELLRTKFSKDNGNVIAKKIVVGGEALLRSQFNYLTEEGIDVNIVNEYGPTEATVGCSVFEFNAKESGEDFKNDIPIGKPIDNVRLYILNDFCEPMPVGIPGEIYIAGEGLARGYLNRTDLTEEKFVKDPFSKEEGARLYRTGDRGRWLADGNIEYLGRIDDQVKIRGYRIELGEIENTLQESGLVRQSVVLARQTSGESKRLVGYVVPDGAFNKEAILNYLNIRLPDYMIPSLWVEMESLPLTQNGKIDKRALPDPDASELISNEYAAPRNETELVLAGIWKELLRVERVGINDNFFELGGDSIITIQVLSRARRMGYELKPKDIFIHQTISGLSAVLAERTASELTAEQGSLTGRSGLLPIQQWYLDGADTDAVSVQDISHFNQSVLLSIDKTVTPEMLGIAVEMLSAHHDALRFIYHKTDGDWIQEYGTEKGVLNLLDLKSAQASSLAEKIKEHAEKYQSSLNIEKGEIAKFVLIETPESETKNRILIIVHHLAVDGVSWRIILDDLELLLNGFTKNEKAELGLKSSSYRQWYEALAEYGKSRRLLSQINYWEETADSYEALKVDKEFTGAVRAKDLESQVMRLDSERTKELLQEVPRAYHTEINDMLLCALAQTICEWGVKDKIVIGLEGHGRESISESSENIDTSRTVGWFTNLYPVLIEPEINKTLSDSIKAVKEQLRRIPDKGLGYGVLKYINKDEKLRDKGNWDVVFNYLGQLDNVVSSGKLFSAAGESKGEDISGEHIVKEKLMINGFVQGGKLTLRWNYSSRHFEKETIAKLTETYKKET